MIPIGDEIRSRRVPVVNYTLLAVNIVVFFLTSLPGDSFFMATIMDFGLIPAQLFGGNGAAALPDFFTSMFLHGSLVHLGGNMLYLWIFGDNVEDAMGHVGYSIFYLAGGVLAALTHALLNMQSTVPTVGASGAIAAVLGAYLVLFPGSRVRTIIPLGYYMRVAMLPAAAVLGFWFVLQLFEGVLSLGAPAGTGGVAFWAHIGGFVVGAVIAKLLAQSPDRYGGPTY
ncbi:MAG: rhomboid family intramembrane serine protease [Caldilineaceae bacterium]|nr:rhomboid family intramembrane serine protease [Caldilineaceae bacterium]